MVEPSLQRGFDMSKLLMRFLNDESGATAIEYGLIAAGIAVAIIAVVQGGGTHLNTTFGSVQSALKYPAWLKPARPGMPGFFSALFKGACHFRQSAPVFGGL